MPRFSFAFSRRKPAADDFDNVHTTTTTTAEQHSFRVFERPDTSGTSFDGGARFARVPRTVVPRPDVVDLEDDDNMFADLKVNRGSGLSNTTKATSTDNSSRHSNASTAPSSADLGGGAGHDDNRHPPRDSSSRSDSKSNSFLDRATRTFSFGVQKKHSVPPPKESCVSDLPPILSLPGESTENRSRGLTCSTTSTATPTQPEPAAGMNLGGDLGSILTSFDDKASMATSKNKDATDNRFPAGIRQVSAVPMTLDPAANSPSPAHGGLSLQSHGRSSPLSRQQMLGSRYPEPDSISRQQMMGSRYPEPEPQKKAAAVVVDEDAKFLQESLAAINLLADPSAISTTAHTHRYRRDEDTFASPSKPIAPKEDNIFEGSLPRASRVSHRYVPRVSHPYNKNKVMTPAEFEKYRLDKENQGSKQQAATEAVKDDDDDDDINYEDDEDEQEQSKVQARQRRKQEAHMAVYRQQMMKVTGESAASAAPIQRPVRTALPPSSSAPQLCTKSMSPGVEDEDEDEDVPLGILQAHGFPARNRPPTRLAHSGSSSNLRAMSQGPPPGRPASVTGEAPSNAARRQTVLPAFARNLPQDPFVGASIARPALRESLSFGDAGQFAQHQQQQPQQQQQQGPLPPGGLVGVIASEERSRALRRGSPSVDNIKLPLAMGPSGPHGPGFDPISGIPPHMMYGPGSLPGMAPMQPPQPPSLAPGGQAQIHMTQQMQQFMQMQMHMMHMMAANQGGGGHPMQPPMQPSYGGGDLSSRHSMMSDPVRAMSMVHSNSPYSQQQPQDAHFAPPGSAAGYAPSIAPSERSNVGLPGRYRPVSQMPAPSMPHPAPGHQRSITMSGRLSSWGDDKSRSTVRLADGAGEGSDEDDEQGWAAMKALRERKKSMWKTKKSYGSELAL